MQERLIKTPECLAEGATFLSDLDPRFAQAISQTGPLPLRLRADGFEALLDAIVSQQISVAAADSIWARVKAAGLTDAKALADADDEALRACGLSRPKQRYARALAQADLDYGALRGAPIDEVITQLTELPGIGLWTAEIYAMFALGRADAFAAGDLALQESARILFELPDRPKEKELRDLAKDWTPWRSVAARVLWAYYRIAKEREGIR